MNAYLAQSTEVLEGIGPVIAAELQRIRVFAVADLLRASVEQVAQAAAGLASVRQAQNWIAMANLLQVEAMTPQWAEALVSGGVHTLADLSSKTLDELDTLFADAARKNLIRTTPLPAENAELLKDAMRLCWTGAITATVLDPDNAPVSGAVVRGGRQETVTDAHGRFRVVGLRLGEPVIVTIEEPGIGRHRWRVRHPDRIEIVNVRVWKIPHRRPLRTAPATRSELAGQSIHDLWSKRIRTRHTAELRDGDLLRLHSWYQNGDDAKLISRLLTQEDDDVFVSTFRVSRDLLPTEARPGDHFLFSGGELTSVPMDSRRLRTFKLRLRMKRAFADRPAPTSHAEVRQLVHDRTEWMIRHGLIKRRG